jgi:ribosomal protein L37E
MKSTPKANLWWVDFTLKNQKQPFAPIDNFGKIWYNALMEEFIGQKCLICDGVFEKNSDIAVCPECGTPYHRACFKKRGHCINNALHESGGEWIPDRAESEASAETLCKRCGRQNRAGALFCESCGFPLESFIKTENPEHRERLRENENVNASGFEGISDELIMNPGAVNYDDPLCGFNPEEVFDEDVKLSEIADYVKFNTHYYLPIFKNIKKYGQPLMFNFTALFFPELFFAYRKMPLYAVGALLIRMFLAIPSFIAQFSQVSFPGLEEITAWAGAFNIESQSFQTLLFLFSIANLIRMWYFASKANAIYYKKVINSIRFWRNVYSQRNEFPEYFENINSFDGLLKKKGGTSVALLLFFLVLFFVPSMCVVAITLF